MQDEPVRAEGGPPREALAAAAARRLDRERDPGAHGQPLDALANGLDLAAALVAEHDRRGVRVSRRRDVGVADAGCEHPHPHLARAGPGHLDTLDAGNVSEALEHERADGFDGRHRQPATTSGSESSPRTSPRARQTGGCAGSSANAGSSRASSASITAISRRATLAPRQRWWP